MRGASAGRCFSASQPWLGRGRTTLVFTPVALRRALAPSALTAPVSGSLNCSTRRVCPDWGPCLTVTRRQSCGPSLAADGLCCACDGGPLVCHSAAGRPVQRRRSGHGQHGAVDFGHGRGEPSGPEVAQVHRVTLLVQQGGRRRPPPKRLVFAPLCSTLDKLWGACPELVRAGCKQLVGR